MRYVVVSLFLLVSAQSLGRNCKVFEKAAEYLSPDRFMRASRELFRTTGKKELSLQFQKLGRARSYVHNFPIFKKFNLGSPGSNGWEKYYSRMERSPLNGKRTGWEIRRDGVHARTRIDIDVDGRAHYNIEVTARNTRGSKETYKLAVEFASCSGRPCTLDVVQEIVSRL